MSLCFRSESFLVHTHFREHCQLTGNDRSQVWIGGQQWTTFDFETRYIFEGMFASVRCPTPVRWISLVEQIRCARLGWTSQTMWNEWTRDSDNSDITAMLQVREAMQPFRLSTMAFLHRETATLRTKLLKRVYDNRLPLA